MDLEEAIFTGPMSTEPMWEMPSPTEAHTISIYANQTIWSGHTVIASSDKRIKDIEGKSDGSKDLQTLLGIDITDYRYKDQVIQDDTPQKKVIAQQLETVFPQAVSRQTNVVPDIYEKAKILEDGWIELATDLKKGERVRLIATEGDENIGGAGS